MVGSFVLYHPDTDAAGIAALVVGINPGPLLDDAGGDAAGPETLNLAVFPDEDGPELPEPSPETAEAPDQVWSGWAPYRATDVPRGQPGKDPGPFWSPLAE